jgi:hypothetical protein
VAGQGWDCETLTAPLHRWTLGLNKSLWDCPKLVSLTVDMGQEGAMLVYTNSLSFTRESKDIGTSQICAAIFILLFSTNKNSLA